MEHSTFKLKTVEDPFAGIVKQISIPGFNIVDITDDNNPWAGFAFVRAWSVEKKDHVGQFLFAENIESAIFLVNGNRRFSFSFEGSATRDCLVNCDDTFLKEICDAEELAIKVTLKKGDNEVIVISHDSQGAESLPQGSKFVTGKGFILFARCYYNAINQTNAYPNAEQEYTLYKESQFQEMARVEKHIQTVPKPAQGGSSRGLWIAIIIFLVLFVGLIIWANVSLQQGY